MFLRRWINQGIARLAGKWPALARRLVAGYEPLEFENIPWTPVTKALDQSKIALVTTAGIHHREQQPFDMNDKMGDPSYRILDSDSIERDYRITHDYYDHRDAEQDLNVVLPLGRLKERVAAERTGSLNHRHFSFMGHIDGEHIQTLVKQSAPAVAAMLLQDGVDAVLLTPA